MRSASRASHQTTQLYNHPPTITHHPPLSCAPGKIKLHSLCKISSLPLALSQLYILRVGGREKGDTHKQTPRPPNHISLDPCRWCRGVVSRVCSVCSVCRGESGVWTTAGCVLCRGWAGGRGSLCGRVEPCSFRNRNN